MVSSLVMSRDSIKIRAKNLHWSQQSGGVVQGNVCVPVCHSVPPLLVPPLSKTPKNIHLCILHICWIIKECQSLTPLFPPIALWPAPHAVQLCSLPEVQWPDHHTPPRWAYSALLYKESLRLWLSSIINYELHFQILVIHVLLGPGHYK